MRKRTEVLLPLLDYLKEGSPGSWETLAHWLNSISLDSFRIGGGNTRNYFSCVPFTFLSEIVRNVKGEKDLHPSRFIKILGDLPNTLLQRKMASINLALQGFPPPPSSPFLYVLYQQHMLLQGNTTDAWRPPQHSSSKRWGQKGKKRMGEKNVMGVRLATVRPKRKDGITLHHTWISHLGGWWYGETQESVSPSDAWMRNVALRGQGIWRSLCKHQAYTSGLTWLGKCIWVGNSRLGSEKNRVYLQKRGQKFIVQRSPTELAVRQMMQHAKHHPQDWHFYRKDCQGGEYQKMQEMGEWESGLYSVVLSLSRDGFPVVPHEVWSTNLSQEERSGFNWYGSLFRWREKAVSFASLPLWNGLIEATYMATAAHRRGYALLLYLRTLLLDAMQ